MDNKIVGKALIISIGVLICFNIALPVMRSDGSATIVADTTKEPVANPRIYYKSPGLAMLLSAVIPGGGQFYTENFLKSVLFVGAEGTLSYLAVKNHLNYNQHGDDNYRKQRNNLLWWLASVKLLSIADAYVSANMYKFKDQMKLTFDYQPKQQQFSFGLLYNLTPHPLSLYPKF